MCRRCAPLRQRCCNCGAVKVPDLHPCPRRQLGTDFLGVLLNPPWATVTPKQVESLNLPKVCPLGFVFVWVEKEVLDQVLRGGKRIARLLRCANLKRRRVRLRAQVVDVLVRLKYVYVENLTWVLMAPNNRVRLGYGRSPVHRQCRWLPF
jgi:hypothetical protein